MNSVDDTARILQLVAREPCQVLVVDDDELVRERLRALVEANGYVADTVDNAPAALAMLKGERYSILMTDWQMPGMNGVELCRAVRAHVTQCFVYLIVFSVRSDEADAVVGLRAGADDYIGKDCPSDELLARLEAARRIVLLERSLRAANDRNQRLSITDPLTGAFNRRYFNKHLRGELERARRYRHPLALLMLDVDRFKEVNDSFGHQAGDEVLSAVVQTTNSELRASCDWIARIGGEEFAIVLPETSCSGALAVAEKVRARIAGRAVKTAAGQIALTVSLGVGAIEDAHTAATITESEFLSTVDSALYRAKEGGRNRWTLADVRKAKAGNKPKATNGPHSATGH